MHGVTQGWEWSGQHVSTCNVPLLLALTVSCFLVQDADVHGQSIIGPGEQRVRAKAGSTAFLPRDVPHTFRNVGTTPSKVLVVIIPARFVGFFDEVHALTKPTPEQAMELGKKDGLTFLPPPKGN